MNSPGGWRQGEEDARARLRQHHGQRRQGRLPPRNGACMSDPVKVAIIGSGPAGLSAASRAAQLGLSHILLEKT
ncbi:MAG: FAD-binding protein, partial [Sphingopyxis sp.]|uniref:FAD-binding protein n=1 Tax=Sphingopyxis sp. TaxID=1908224 RepID=UPI0040369B01